MSAVSRADIERALALPGERRSDYDLNPGWMARGRELRPAAVLCGLTLPLLGAEYNVWVALAVLLAAWLVTTLS